MFSTRFLAWLKMTSNAVYIKNFETKSEKEGIKRTCIKIHAYVRVYHIYKEIESRA